MDEPPDAVTMTITPRTSTVLVLADEIARRHGHDFVGTEHLLLALIEEREGIAGRVLEALHAAAPARARTEQIIRSATYRASSSSEPSTSPGSLGPTTLEAPSTTSAPPTSLSPSASAAPSPPPLRLTVPLQAGVRRQR